MDGLFLELVPRLVLRPPIKAKPDFTPMGAFVKMFAPIDTRSPRGIRAGYARRGFMKGRAFDNKDAVQACTATQYCLAVEALHSILIIEGPSLHKSTPRVSRAAYVYP